MARQYEETEMEAKEKSACHSQCKGLVVFWSPAVVLGLGGVLSLLIAEMRANDVDLHEGPENSRSLPT